MEDDGVLVTVRCCRARVVAHTGEVDRDACDRSDHGRRDAVVELYLAVAGAGDALEQPQVHAGERGMGDREEVCPALAVVRDPGAVGLFTNGEVWSITPRDPARAGLNQL